MKTLWKQALIAAALGTAMSASAQYTSPPSSAAGAAPDPSPMTAPATGAGAASQQDRVPANRDRDAQKVCASVPAADREACIARENAKNNDKTPMSSGSTTSPKSPGASTGSSSGTSNSTGATDGGTGAPK
jgi:hypothetical protein